MMLRTLEPTREWDNLRRWLAVCAFALLTALGARVTIEIGVVPFTLQTLMVVLSGLVLGARDAALSQLLYIGAIALGVPIDARMLGSAALMGATAGYLIGFVPAAFAAGWLAERGAAAYWRRWLAGIVGMAIIYLCGALVLKQVSAQDWAFVWANGIAPFIAADAAKALVAAGLAEGGRALLRR